jgi:hypothetical protein
VINQHFFSFNNPEQHLEQKTSRSYSLSLSTPFIMLSTPSINSDVDLLCSKNKFNVYLKLFDFKNSPQVYVEANHVDDAANAKPFDDANVEVSDVAHDEVGDVVTIPFLQFYNPAFCLDMKDFDVCDLDASGDHVFFDTIVCHQFPCDPKDDVSTSIYDSIPCSDSQLSNYPIAFEVCQRSRFLEIDDKELENVNMDGCRSNKHVEI